MNTTETHTDVGTPGLSATVAALTPEQMNQQVDLAQRLLGMAVNGTPSLRVNGVPASGIELALHALLTAYMSLADAYELQTEVGAAMAFNASRTLFQVHLNRTAHAPSQVQ